MGATIMRKITEMKSCFEHLLGMFSFCVRHLPSCKCEAWLPRIQGITKDWGGEFFYRSFAKNGDQFNENLC